MKKLNSVLLFVTLVLNFNHSHSGNWCKVIYSKQTSEGKLKDQLSKCKNSDNIFMAIDSSFINSGHLLNSMIAENCDLRREVITTIPRKSDPYFTAVCEFRRNFLR